MIKVGITGGIGSGKSIVCEVFKILGVPVFLADNVARDLQQNDNQVRSYLINLFGESIYSQGGMLDRKKLAHLIFNNKELMTKVNQIIHPVVRENFDKWAGMHADNEYIIYEAAILFESGYYKDFDLNILVIADENIRIKRVMQRDNSSEESVRQRINNQMKDAEKMKMADYVVENNEKSLLIPQIIELDKVLKNHGKVR
jgi:dephospho-CoA kinase